MASIFSKIAKGEIPCHKVAESDKYLAFLDINPLVKGHLLVIPKEETDYFFDLNDAAIAEIMVFARKVACALKKTFPERRVGVAVVGFDVPHAHVHLVPMLDVKDMDFNRPRLNLSTEEFQTIARTIADNMIDC